MAKLTQGRNFGLRQFRETHPVLSKILDESNRSRLGMLARYNGGVRFRGVECLLLHLPKVDLAYRQGPDLRKIAFLVTRAQTAFEFCIEAGLVGYFAFAMDSLRSVMEIEFLLAEFAARPSALTEWLQLPDKEREKQFSPNRLRQLKANRLGIEISHLRDHADYRGHSMLLHVAPDQRTPFPRGRLDDDHALRDMVFWEFFEHGRRLLEAADELLLSKTPSWIRSIDNPDLKEFVTAYNRVKEMEQIFRALMLAGEPPAPFDEQDQPSPTDSDGN